MATPKTTLDDTLVDVRSVERNIKKAYITEAQVRSVTDALPDASHKMEPLALDLEAEIAMREERRREREERQARLDAQKGLVSVNEADQE